ncbi:DUF1802 family protein [Paenibacillus spiritus]|uniref:DUF1802 family protein n=1 Tax=Paenibacillus spiritus TaxID=2496557 RepID=A0A5J5FZK5_9BACL|nr:DUF1802 family protein [Paenibacillus spiritus]KAA8999679.1 DUF1802 family protein [Paenibacillus spiritus]
MKIEPTALKEWAAAAELLGEGESILLLRKGGIREETKRFELRSSSFYFFPTYEHQKPWLFKEPYRPLVEKSLAEAHPGADRITLFYWAEAADDLEIRTEEELEALYPYHIWTKEMAAERLRWKPREPLHALLLRVYRLDQPLEIPVHPEYGGCRSWIGLQDTPEPGKSVPVLDEERFEARRQEIRQCLIKLRDYNKMSENH